ncbi:hypothetical protein [Staphylococcus chromogenes]|uniref:hypothetical protein n=1 Tax=Staphylococcus chromogenes TaxID=46126 RepID=UPI000D1B62D1|nr:hypothetical protein [Staphylococcus chromogenes]MCE4966278.1 hypothetical protein [Staphylococcus chromogenes]MDT0700596.1 hypothetical protein [Staphylococcus chromogenes]MDU0451622.1 hypothetical protein [Staphylococcus chromogenes]PTF68301.1 hypothetical protein BUY01_09060 [Staphylococcus chromogenes]PTF74006.1 hypothetical protein BUY03_00620 [Staphylococcus chromogenes]
MSTQTLGIIMIILLLLSFIPNVFMLYKANKEGTSSTRFKLMVGVDAILLVLVIAAIVLFS